MDGVGVRAAITIRPPWSLAVAAGVKLVENRGRPTSHRGPIAIHSGATWSAEGGADVRIRQWWWSAETWYGATALAATDFSHSFRRILAVADLVDCHEAAQLDDGATCCQPWGDRRYVTKRGTANAWHLVLGNVCRLAEPVPAVGKIAVPWALPEDVAAEVERQLDALAGSPA